MLNSLVTVALLLWGKKKPCCIIILIIQIYTRQILVIYQRHHVVNNLSTICSEKITYLSNLFYQREGTPIMNE